MKTVLIILLTMIVTVIILLIVKTWKVKATIDEKYLTIKLFNIVIKRIQTPEIIRGLVTFKDDGSAQKAALRFKDVIPHMEFKRISVELSDSNPLMIEEILIYGIICQYNQLIRSGQIIGPSIEFKRKKGELMFRASVYLTVNGAILIYHYLKTRRSKIWKTSARSTNS